MVVVDVVAVDVMVVVDVVISSLLLLLLSTLTGDAETREFAVSLGAGAPGRGRVIV